MSSKSVSVEPHGTITVLKINRPPANAITMEFAQEFEAAFEASMAIEPRALVLTGVGPFFSGGLDLKIVPGYSPQEQHAFLVTLNRLVGRLYACPVPVVGGINGHALAGGFILTLNADYRVGPTEGAEFGLTEARIGIPFPAATMIVLQAELAPQDVRYITLHASRFGPDEARARGVLDELQPPDAVLERAMEVAQDLASMPPDSYRRIKQQVRGAAIAQIEKLNATGSDPLLKGWFGDVPA
jgi:enoyl-CoA hydratase